MRFKVKKASEEMQIVWGEVYIPNRIDSHGHMMLPSDVQKLAHSFMRKQLGTAIDTNHDNWPNGSYPVESTVIDYDHPLFAKGAWVLGVKVTDKRLWKQIKSGELAGYSFEGTAVEQEATIVTSVMRHNFGWTEPADDGHRHFYFIALDRMGKVVSGHTSTKAGHKHAIMRGTATESTNKHKHRFSFA